MRLPEWSHNMTQFIETYNVDQYAIDTKNFSCRRRRLAAEGIIFWSVRALYKDNLAELVRLSSALLTRLVA